MRELKEIRALCKDLEIPKAMFTVRGPDGKDTNFFYLEVGPDEYQFWEEGDMPTNYVDEEFVYETKF